MNLKFYIAISRLLILLLPAINAESDQIPQSFKKSDPEKQCPCGGSHFEKSAKKEYKYPWLVFIHSVEKRRERLSNCGGAIISSKFILTSAECLLSLKAPMTCNIKAKPEFNCYVKPGEIEIEFAYKEHNEKNALVKKIYTPSFFQKMLHVGNIGLIKLRKPIRCSSRRYPICLTNLDSYKINEPIKAAGWKMTKTNRGYSKDIVASTVHQVTHYDCSLEILSENSLCAQGKTRSACEDGSALFVKARGNYYAIAVTTEIDVCSHLRPNYYTKTSTYYSFIKRHVSDLPDSTEHGHGKEQCPCGIIKGFHGDSTIVNGTNANARDYPWLVSIHKHYVDYKDRQFFEKLGLMYDASIWGECGGVIISPQYILTAAHCLFEERQPYKCLVEGGDKSCFIAAKHIQVGIQGTSSSAPRAKVSVKKFITHPNFSVAYDRADIALIKLTKPIKCSPFHMPICVPKVDIVKKMDTVFIAGWGIFTNESTDLADRLKEGTGKVVDSQICSTFGEKNNKDILCLVGKKYQTACQGDSGSPAIKIYKKRYYSVGIASKLKVRAGCSYPIPVASTPFDTLRYFIKYYTHLPNIFHH